MALSFSKLKYFDIPLLVVTGLLLIAGLGLLYATSVGSQSIGVFYRQLVFAGVGLAIFAGFSLYDYKNLAKSNRVAYVLLVLLLVGVLLFAREIRGSSRWIDLGIFRVQPAEIAKVVVIIGLARWLYLLRGQINSWKSIAITFLYAFIPAVLVMLEPDLGSSIIIMGTWLGMLLISPMSKKFSIGLVLIGVVAAGFAWQFVLHDYQRTRIEVFLDPSSDPRGTGYNVRQAIIAIGSGQAFGRGLGQGLQSQLKFLPERQTDFIFASASEEIGFSGNMVLLALYFYLCNRVFRIMQNTRDDLAFYMSGGVLFMFFGQILINVGMNIGIMPVTGIPLPFLTAGGSSLFTTFIALGIVQNIARQSKSLRF